MLNMIINKILNKTATNEESEVFLEHVNDTIDNSYDSWKKRYDNMSEEEERINFMRIMKKQGCQGNTYEEAMEFLDNKYPNNLRREKLEERRLRKNLKFYK